MITGFNTNVWHCGREFHVQTEDSGRNHPHVISHLYHGGTILASEKTDYSERVADAQDLTTEVRALMETQHKAMLDRLQRGEFDAVITERLDRPAGAQGPTTTPTSVPSPLAGTGGTGGTAGSATSGTAGSVAGSTTGSVTPPLEIPPTQPASQGPPTPVPPPGAAATPAEPAFGAGLVSDRPLDELILDYLVEQARDRTAGTRAKG